MQYWELVTRSFGIAWRHKYLWLIALFAGEGGGSFQFGQSGRFGSGNQQPSLSAAQDWFVHHAGLIVALSVISLVVTIAFFVLAAICEGATVRAGAEHDAERQFGLRLAWRVGLQSMWTIVRLRLLLILLGLPAAIVLVAIVVAFIVAVVAGNTGAAVALGLFGLLLVLVAIVYYIYLDLLGRLGIRAAVLEQRSSAVAALRRGHGLIRGRLGRVLLVWLLSLGVGFVIGIAALLVFGVLFAVFAVPAAIAATSGAWPIFVLIVIVGIVVALPLLILTGAYFSAQGSVYWTLAFRRLDIGVVAFPSPAPQPIPPPAPSAG